MHCSIHCLLDVQPLFEMIAYNREHCRITVSASLLIVILLHHALNTLPVLCVKSGAKLRECFISERLKDVHFLPTAKECILLGKFNQRWVFFVFVFFSVRLLLVLRGHSVFSSPPQRPMSSHFEGFFYPVHLFSYLNS